MALLILTVY
ncbi:hypothetical protein NP493_204g06010 [Ridgeia piscesae]|uniref:Uncharacterized protein n=1 Tax=Ridgeia piscesae TaxID=27915 RepID=A0AAD9P154_RIDPI|nr:hypothetical protein NP493_204g06010 [Ridgeia piscesae]